jgi:hypothetical protein
MALPMVGTTGRATIPRLDDRWGADVTDEGAVVPSLEDSKERLIAALEDFTETLDPCQDGHVEHGPEDHIGRRIVHTMAGAFGADWDYDEAVEFIRGADKVIRANGMAAALGHGGAAYNNGRWVAFATRRVEA